MKGNSMVERLKDILKFGTAVLIVVSALIIAENLTQSNNQKRFDEYRNQGYVDKTLEAPICDISEEPSRLRSEHPESKTRAYVTVEYNNEIFTLCIPLNLYNTWKELSTVKIDTLYNEKEDNYIFDKDILLVNRWNINYLGLDGGSYGN